MAHASLSYTGDTSYLYTLVTGKPYFLWNMGLPVTFFSDHQKQQKKWTNQF